MKNEIFYTAKYDKVFKTIMIENKDILEKVLETVLKKKVEVIEFIHEELPIKIGRASCRERV